MEKGKKVCNELKAVRQSIADANGIEYTPNVCTHKGDCPGTCPACEEEVKYLEQELSRRNKLGRATVVAGLSIAVATCASSCFSPKGSVAYTDDHSKTLKLEGNDPDPQKPEPVLQGDVVKVIEVVSTDTIKHPVGQNCGTNADPNAKNQKK